jgi:uncharacterized membrane protein
VKRQEHHAPVTVGEHVADAVASNIGSWRFVIGQALFTCGWLLANSLHGWQHWDSYPYVLLNLVYSFQAGFTGPLLLLAGNRAAQRDRAIAARDDEEIGLLLALQKEQMALLKLAAEHIAQTKTAKEVPDGSGD